MHLFQSEWLREAPRPVAHSYAQRTYGLRSARRLVDVPPDATVAAVLLGPGWTLLEGIAPSEPPHVDRAA